MELNFKDFGGTGETLVILHGLFGSSQNWMSAGKALAKDLHPFALDLRNHGDSPHSDIHTVEAMSEDLHLWREKHAPAPLLLLGHSMGGLVAMDYALRHPGSVRGVVVVDIAPRSYEAGHELEFRALSLDLSGFASRQEIDRAMAKIHPDAAVRKFLQMNLKRTEAGYEWKLNRKALEQERYIEHFRLPGTGTYEGPALFIAGGESPYVRRTDHDLIRSRFPQAKIRILPDAGHWLHYRNESQFLLLVREFIHSLPDSAPPA